MTSKTKIMLIIYSYFKSLKFFPTPIPEPLGFISRKFAHKVAKSRYFEKSKLNRNIQMILLKMMYNMSMLRHPFSNERWGGGGGSLNYLPLLFCKSV